MSKLAILGDLHFGARNSADAIIYHQKKFFDFFFGYLEKNNVKTILQLGDIFDARRQTNNKALRFAYRDFFDVLEEKGIEIYILVGNHSLYYKESCDLNSDELLLQRYNNVKVISKPNTLTFDNCTFTAIPWLCDENRQECLDYMAKSTSDYCLGHFEINNFEVMPNVTFEGGLEENLFKRYKKVFSGHFHIKSEKGNIYYVGTPFQLNWGDIHKEKSFVVFDTETQTFESIKNPDEFHVYMEYDDVNKKYSDPRKIESNSFIKLIVKNKSNPTLFNKYTEEIYKREPADVKFVEGSLVNLAEQEEIKLTIQTMEDTITNYVKNSGYNNKEALTKFMLMLYNEAIMGVSEE